MGALLLGQDLNEEDRRRTATCDACNKQRAGLDHPTLRHGADRIDPDDYMVEKPNVDQSQGIAKMPSD